MPKLTNTTMERALLSCCLIDSNKAVAKVYNLVKDKMFHEPKYRLVWVAIASLFEDEKGIDFLTVSDYFRDKSQLKDFQGEEDYFYQISKEETTAAHIVQYAEGVREAYACRSIKIIIEKYLKTIEESDQNSQELSSDIIAKLSNIHSAMIGTEIVSIQDIAKNIAEETQRIKELEDDDKYKNWLNIGIPSLDTMLSGLRPGRLYMIAGVPGGGKSDLLINWMINLSKKISVGVISAEMTKEDLVLRAISNYTKIDSKQIENGTLSDSDMGDIWRKISFNDRKIYIDDSTAPTAMDIKARAITMQAQLGVEVLLIDHLQELKHHTKSANENADWRNTTKALRDIGKDLNIPIVLLNQLTKEALVEGQRPQMKYLRQTGAEESDVVIMLFNTKKDENEILEMIVRKNRRGPLGIIQCQYDKTTGRQGELGDEPPF